MAITIQGIRIRSVTVSNEEGSEKIRAEYELVSSNGAVLAKQSLNSHSEYGSSPVFTPSIETIKKLRDAITAYKKDAEVMMGFE
jgi:ribosomal protein L24